MNYTGRSTIFDYIDRETIPSGNHTITVDSVVLNIEVIRVEGDYTYTGSSIGNTTADTYSLILIVDGVLTVASNANLIPLVRKKGFFVYGKKGIINNGTISMSLRGAIGSGSNLSLVKDINNTYRRLSPIGGSGASRQYVSEVTTRASGINGGNSSVIACGGGGGGAIWHGLGTGYTVQSGAGSPGTTWSGGSGSGGVSVYDPDSGTIGNSSDDASGNGGKGSGGFAYRITEGTAFIAGGGAGNPGGLKGFYGDGDGTYAGDGEDGTGGLLVVCGKYIANNGIITSNGGKGGNADNNYRGAAGGGSGGGAVVFIHESTLTQGNVNVSGGSGGYGEIDIQGGYYGGNGGSGSITAINATFFEKKEGILLCKGNNKYLPYNSSLLVSSKDTKITESELELISNTMNTNNRLFNKMEIKTSDTVVPLTQKPLTIRLN